MYRNIVSLTSVLALFAGLTGYTATIEAHEDDKKCNVLLDGDGEPVKEADSDTIDHAGSHACGAGGDEASVPTEGTEKKVTNVAPSPVTVEPMTVYFDSGSDKLSAGASAQVQAFAKQLFETSPKSIEVIGYTDTSGSAALNEKLSKARAANVITSLVDAGLLSDIIEQSAVGENSLAVPTADGKKEANNRRVVISPEY